jgi:hypothetical protein
MEVTDCDKRYMIQAPQKLFVKVLFVEQKKWIWHMIKFWLSFSILGSFSGPVVLQVWSLQAFFLHNDAATREATVFNTGKPLQPSLMFAFKTRGQWYKTFLSIIHEFSY